MSRYPISNIHVTFQGMIKEIILAEQSFRGGLKEILIKVFYNIQPLLTLDLMFFRPPSPHQPF